MAVLEKALSGQWTESMANAWTELWQVRPRAVRVRFARWLAPGKCCSTLWRACAFAGAELRRACAFAHAFACAWSAMHLRWRWEML